MYADKFNPLGTKRSVKDRLGNGYDTYGAEKRQRQDVSGKSIQEESQHAYGKATDQDLRRKLLQMEVPQSSKINSQSNVSGMPDKRLSTTKNPFSDATPTVAPDVKGRSDAELKKPTAQIASKPVTTEHKKQAQELTVSLFLKRLGLSKYAITFQAEEVDMIALKHMNEADFKEMGLPMGPRKKILLALSSLKEPDVKK
ncbi:ankyrin repeat and SAM domain-containing protein 6 isoform X2 [Amborella trichopoda]|uniref:ankyrin repeat and SAM domain-containing protein 6 isoform X2 n=1 Tax=Amborella trichopoda TaxID=13333 RepID=UPI0005D4011D|nr:ankyrin repeat and SAM domain-containing protein 6 isoform X2 [Amborella trichopoda]|eukprot:XP_011622592.1 ankyrin repeat and SAM domain-containing protein 6 isoform X2 [Amborella trichopoda]